MHIYSELCIALLRNAITKMKIKYKYRNRYRMDREIFIASF